MEFSKFNIIGRAKGEKSWYLDVSLKFTMNNVDAIGEIDLSTGTVTNLELLSKFKIDVDSNIGFLVPGLDNLAEHYLKKIVKNAIKNGMGEINGKKVFYGLNDVIPPYKYVVDGVDIGWELQQKLTGLINGEFISLTLKEVPLKPLAKPYLCYQPGKLPITSKFVELNISNNAFLRLTRTDVQTCDWNWNSGQQPDY